MPPLPAVRSDGITDGQGQLLMPAAITWWGIKHVLTWPNTLNVLLHCPLNERFNATYIILDSIETSTTLQNCKKVTALATVGRTVLLSFTNILILFCQHCAFDTFHYDFLFSLSRTSLSLPYWSQISSSKSLTLRKQLYLILHK